MKKQTKTDTNIQERIKEFNHGIAVGRSECLAEVEKIIYERMDWIESDGWENYNPIDVLRDIKEEFKQKLKEMKK